MRGATKRRHLFEFEDQSWLAPRLRNTITDFLREALVLGYEVYRPAVPLLVDLLHRSGERRIVDLCSGGSGPWATLKGQLEQSTGPLTLMLTDKFPNVPAFERAVTRIDDGRTSYRADPVDASRVPGDLGGVRTLFTSFHHLSPELARRTLRDAWQDRAPIGIFEHTERRWPTVALTALFAPYLFAAHCLRHRPPDARRFLLTFLLPVLPVLVTWDGIVSHLRTYTVEELEDMVGPCSSPDYRWTTGQIPGSGPHPTVTYLIGCPTEHCGAP